MASMEMTDSSLNEGELSQKCHQLVNEQKEQGKYLTKVEQQLSDVEEDKSRLETRLQFSFLSGGRKSMAPSMASFHFNHPCDMTNVSLDADDSVG